MKLGEDAAVAIAQASVRKGLTLKLLVLKLLLALFFVAIAARLFQLQVIDAARYQNIARKQYEQEYTLPATRGRIYDRNGNILVSNTVYVSYGADPVIVGKKMQLVAERFAAAFGKPASFYRDRFRVSESASGQRRFVWLERRVRPETANRLNLRGIHGVIRINEPKRLYHYGELAGPLLGLTDIDNEGIAGLELQLNGDLKGTEGSVTFQRDGLGRTRPSADYPQIDPVDGDNIFLTIDLGFQAIVEEELRRGIERNKADGGLAVMVHPETGELLAAAMYPGVNPNDLSSVKPGDAKNRIVADIFEPGSAFKIVTASAAYEYHLVEPEQVFDAENGTYRVPLGNGRSRLIRDTHQYNVITFQEAIEHSSNIVMAKVSEIIGPDKLYRQARDFGFGIPTGIELPGEVRGRLKKPFEWSGTTLNSLSYGYEVAVTPLQLVMAYAAVANDGVLLAPSIIARIEDYSGSVVRENRPDRIRRVVSSETAARITNALEGVIERGTGIDIKTEGMRIAGKTGTARKVIDGKYVPGSYTSSFIGFFPVENPEAVLLVMMDTPRAQGYYGGTTSGPVFRAIAERVLQLSPKFTAPNTLRAAATPGGSVVVPDVCMLEASIARRIIESHDLNCEEFGDGEYVVRQSPPAGRTVEPGEVVRLALVHDQAKETEPTVLVPNVRGMSLRRAINRLVIDDFHISVRGSGVVVEQSPRPGVRVSSGASIIIRGQPKSTTPAVLF